MIEERLQDVARRCLAETGPVEAERLRGGGNNRLYRLSTDRGVFVLKHYFRHPGDLRDRLDAEFRFCTFAWDHGLRCLPQAVGRDDAESVGIYTFIPGDRVEAAGPEELGQALAFFLELNRHLADGASLPEASEACFSILDHVRMLDRRLERLRGIGGEEPLDDEARRFVAWELGPAWAAVRGDFERVSDAALPAHGRVLSPSDFGFHNALRGVDGRLTFLDFEYAGWDDPAKLVCDFFSQVAVPAPASHFDGFAAAVAAILPDPEGMLARTALLRPLYGLKWCCIVLNHFLPVDQSRKAFAQTSDNPAAAKQAQLDRARALLHGLMKGTP